MSERDENREGGERRSPEVAILDIAKKAVSTSVKTLLASDILPKELISQIDLHLKDFKGDLVNLLSDEFKRLLERIDFAGEIKKVLSDMKVEIRIEMTFHEKEGRIKPKNQPLKIEKKRAAKKKAK